MKRKILITTGGSGGHVVPALTLYEHLKDDFDIFLFSDYRGSKFIDCLLYTSPSPRDSDSSRMPSSA